tara:strand:- start:7172 stop:7753 length:582 start_codon:yes stop_codon:yes gene_type:complete
MSLHVYAGWAKAQRATETGGDMNILEDVDWEQEYDDMIAVEGEDAIPLELEAEADANKRLRSMRYWIKEMIRVDELYDEELSRLQAWYKKHQTRIKKRILWNEDALKAYLWSTNLKSIDLPEGVLKRRKGSERIDVVLDEVFIDWCQKGGHDLFRTKHQPDKAAIKKFVKDSGEEPPGVELNVGEDSFSVALS